MHITDRLKSARNLQTSHESEDMTMFDAWKTDINSRALSDARLAVKQELDTHESTVAKHIAQVEAAETKRDAAIALQVAAEAKAVSLEKSLKLVKENWSTTKANLASNAEGYESKMTDEYLKHEQLKISNADLQGQLSQALKAPKAAPQPIIKPTVIPDFVFKKTQTGMDGLATEWTATPKRLN